MPQVNILLGNKFLGEVLPQARHLDNVLMIEKFGTAAPYVVAKARYVLEAGAE